MWGTNLRVTHWKFKFEDIMNLNYWYACIVVQKKIQIN